MQKPRSEGSPQMVGLVADVRDEEAAVPSRLVDRALATKTPRSPCGGNSICVDGVFLWCDMAATVTFLPSGRLPPARVGRREVVGRGDLLYNKLDVPFRSCIMSWWTQQRAWMMVCRERVRRQFRACRTPLECVAFFRKHKAPVKDFSSTVQAFPLLLSTRTWTCMKLDSLAATVFALHVPPL